ncbi:hypothetical protein Tco_1065967, partial [Tanacetum coccineum]
MLGTPGNDEDLREYFVGSVCMVYPNGLKSISVYRLGEARSAAHFIKSATYLAHVGLEIIKALDKCGTHLGKTGALLVLTAFIYFMTKCGAHKGKCGLADLFTKSLPKEGFEYLVHRIDKTAKAYEEQQNVAAVEQHMLDDDVEKLVEGEEEESDGVDFADTVLLSDEDFGNRLEPRSHKDEPKEINDDDDEKKDDKKGDDDNDDDDHDDHALIRSRESGSSEIKTEKMQTPIPSSPRSSRTDLSSDKAIAHKLMVSVTPTPATSSK